MSTAAQKISPAPVQTSRQTSVPQVKGRRSSESSRRRSVRPSRVAYNLESIATAPSPQPAVASAVLQELPAAPADTAAAPPLLYESADPAEQQSIDPSASASADPATLQSVDPSPSSFAPEVVDPESLQSLPPEEAPIEYAQPPGPRSSAATSAPGVATPVPEPEEPAPQAGPSAELAEEDAALLQSAEVVQSAQKIVELGQDPSRLQSLLPEQSADAQSGTAAEQSIAPSPPPGGSELQLPQLYVPTGSDQQSLAEPDPAPLQEPTSPEDGARELESITEGARVGGSVEQLTAAAPSPTVEPSGTPKPAQPAAPAQAPAESVSPPADKGSTDKTFVAQVQDFYRDIKKALDPFFKSTQVVAFYARLKTDYALAIRTLEARKYGGAARAFRFIDRTLIRQLPKRFATFTDDLRLFLGYFLDAGGIITQVSNSPKTITRHAGGRVTAFLTEVRRALLEREFLTQIAYAPIFRNHPGVLAADVTLQISERINIIADRVRGSADAAFRPVTQAATAGAASEAAAASAARNAAEESVILRKLRGFIQSAGRFASGLLTTFGKLIETRLPGLVKFLSATVTKVPELFSRFARFAESKVIELLEGVVTRVLSNRLLRAGNFEFLRRFSFILNSGISSSAGRRLASWLPGVGVIVAVISAWADYKTAEMSVKERDYVLATIRTLHVITDLLGGLPLPGVSAAIAFSGDVVTTALELLVRLGRFVFEHYFK